MGSWKLLDKEFVKELVPILEDDDKEKFIDVVKSQKNCCNYGDVLDCCLYMRAKNCALVLLKGELGLGNDQNDQACERGRGTATLLNAIYNLCDPQVMELLLKNCGGRHLVDQPFSHFHPLHLVLAHLKNVKHVLNWSPGDSLIKLIILLCQHEVKPILECARLIAEYSNSVNRVALGFVQHGDLKELVCLLLVAHERVMAPFASGKTINDYASLDKMVSRIINGQSITTLASAAGLLDLFDKAGDALSGYLRSMQSKIAIETVTIEIAKLLIKKAEIQVIFKDVDMTNCYSIHPVRMEYICKELDIKKDVNPNEIKNQKIEFPSLQRDYLFVMGVPAHNECIDEFRRTHAKPPFNYQQTQPFSTACEGHKISTKKHSCGSRSLRDMVWLAMKFKRGVRFL